MQNNTIQSVEPESVQELASEKMQEPLKKTVKKAIKIPIKTVIIIAVVIAVGVSGYIFKGLFIAATVNGSPISRLGIIQKLEKTSGKSLLDSLITEKLIQNEAKAKGISISDEEVNEEIKKVQTQIETQGGTLEEALTGQGMSMEDFRARIILQKDLDKMLGDKINISDEEAEQYIKDNEITLPKGQEAETKSQIKESLIGQKLNTEAPLLIDTLKSKAKIQYFVKY